MSRRRPVSYMSRLQSFGSLATIYRQQYLLSSPARLSHMSASAPQPFEYTRLCNFSQDLISLMRGASDRLGVSHLKSIQDYQTAP